LLDFTHGDRKCQTHTIKWMVAAADEHVSKQMTSYLVHVFVECCYHRSVGLSLTKPGERH
jgi:hypothetical protein